MKTGRRGFLGMFGGAIAAGPAMAKNAMKEVPEAISSNFPRPSNFISGGGGGQTLNSNSLSWEREQLGVLTRLLSGKLTDDEKLDRDNEFMEASDIIHQQVVMSLVSVSPSSKARMLRDARLKRKEERLRAHWQATSIRLAKKIAGL